MTTEPQNQSPGAGRGSSDVVTRRLAILLILTGAAFAADSMLGLSVAPKLWPVLPAVLAVGLIGIYAKRGGRGGMFLASGVYLLCFSAMALYCNFTSWARVAVLWPAFIAFLGLAFLVVFLSGGRRRGHLLLGMLLLSTAVVLWLFVALSGSYWWAAPVLVGVSLLAAERAR